ncbi:phosphohistidine phosphatase SixA [Zavarzinella formosa]|uniref:phosphohistidine phosphatase SixA n=1 Tax=Zavarzinella formosa TaxID=360055 RepID=UPI0002F98C43|nr:phosphohistidine phosphatase SixA [Zavarzinella formosa]
MQIYLIRHGDAVALGERGITEDAERPLTEFGQVQIGRLAHAFITKGHRVNRLLTSPLVRAKETADLLAPVWTLPPEDVIVTEALAPGRSCRRLAKAIRKYGAETIGLVGHEPDLSEFTAWLIGSKKAKIMLEKGGVARVVVDGDEIEKGCGVLAWLLSPEWSSM